jgi:hypothetical protein
MASGSEPYATLAAGSALRVSSLKAVRAAFYFVQVSRIKDARRLGFVRRLARSNDKEQSNLVRL